MRGNTFGKLFSITSFGESHGKAMGVVIDGMPSNIEIDESELHRFMLRRAPGQTKGTTNRVESDRPQVLSGLFEGKTLGSPIAVMIENTNQKSSDYDKLKKEYRAGHADETTMMKYGIRDHRGGGRASGRETVARVVGGFFASQIIPDVSIKTELEKVGDLLSPSEDEAIEYLEKLKADGESCGGVCVIRIQQPPRGLGEPCFDKLKADLAKAMMSIGGVVAFEYGLGKEFADKKGSMISSDENAFGGIEGGISNGKEIVLKVTFKPTSTVGDKAKSGRHDPCIMMRARVVLESMAWMTLADHFLRQRAYEGR
jgi:chorismate synthase